MLVKPLLNAVSSCQEQAARDPALRAAVLIGAGKVFCAGAEMADLDADGLDDPSLHDTISEQIEAKEKPVIAAIHGSALGSGLELALSCHYRLYMPDTKNGLPEPTVGCLPDAEGMQKLQPTIGRL